MSLLSVTLHIPSSTESSEGHDLTIVKQMLLQGMH